VRHPSDELVRVCQFCGFYDLLVSDSLPAVGNVVVYRSLKEPRLLKHVANLVTECMKFIFTDIRAVDFDRTSSGIVKPRDEAYDGGFATARGPNDSHHFSRLNFKADISQHRGVGIVGESYMIEFDLAPESLRLARVRSFRNDGLSVKNSSDALYADRRLRDRIGHRGQVLHGLEELI
jgi:hypothetical protein